MNPYQPTQPVEAVTAPSQIKPWVVAGFTAMLLIGAVWFYVSAVNEHKRQRVSVSGSFCSFGPSSPEDHAREAQAKLEYLDRLLEQIRPSESAEETNCKVQV